MRWSGVRCASCSGRTVARRRMMIVMMLRRAIGCRKSGRIACVGVAVIVLLVTTVVGCDGQRAGRIAGQVAGGFSIVLVLVAQRYDAVRARAIECRMGVVQHLCTAINQ